MYPFLFLTDQFCGTVGQSPDDGLTLFRIFTDRCKTDAIRVLHIDDLDPLTEGIILDAIKRLIIDEKGQSSPFLDVTDSGRLKPDFGA